VKLGGIDITALADQIRALDIGGRQALAMELKLEVATPPRCPARNLRPDPPDRCVRHEDHTGPHVAANGAEWLVALRCRIGATDRGAAVFSRIEGHDGACVALPAAQHEAPRPAREARPARVPRLGTRGVCGCGRLRGEHEGATHTGGIAGTNCKRYRP